MIRILQLLISGHIHSWEKDGSRLEFKREGFTEIIQPCRCKSCGVIKSFEILR